MDVRSLLKQARTSARLTQAGLAERAGVARSVVADYERGRNAPTVKQFERLLAAAGFQLAVQLEPLGADIEQAVRECMGMPIEQRVEKLPAPLPLETFIRIVECVPYVIEGAAAALLQGAPLPVEAVDVAVPDDDAQLATLGRSIGGSQMLRFWIEDQQIWYMINPSV